MTLYHHFFGIDMGKSSFVVCLFGAKSTREYPNSPDGFQKFMQSHKSILPHTLCVVETTGGYELPFL